MNAAVDAESLEITSPPIIPAAALEQRFEGLKEEASLVSMPFLPTETFSISDTQLSNEEKLERARKSLNKFQKKREKKAANVVEKITEPIPIASVDSISFSIRFV